MQNGSLMSEIEQHEIGDLRAEGRASACFAEAATLRQFEVSRAVYGAESKLTCCTM